MVEIIFNFSEGSLIPAQLGGRQYHLSTCFINGFNTAPIVLRLPSRRVFFGVRVQPLAIKEIFGIPAGEFSDIAADLTLHDPSLHSLWHQLAEQNNFDSRVTVFCRWIEGRCRDWQPREKLINEFLCSVDQHDLSVTELANSLCYSPRQVSRKIFEATGMNAEEMLLYKKYLHAIHLMHHSDLSLTEIAYQSHFSDQSHFIRSFRTYAKMTPGSYKQSKSHVQGHIYENVR